MRYVLAVVLAAGAPAYAREARTYQQVLGRDRVVKVLNEVVSEAEERFRNSFLLNDELVSQLRAGGVSDYTITLLGELKGQEVQGKGNFTEALKMAVGKEQAEGLQGEPFNIVEEARGELKVTAAFLRPVELLILQKPAPAGLSRRAVEDVLEKGFSSFLNRFIAERRAAEGNANKLILGNQGLTDFIKRLEAECGKVPCEEIMCCEKCMPCP